MVSVKQFLYLGVIFLRLQIDSFLLSCAIKCIPSLVIKFIRYSSATCKTFSDTELLGFAKGLSKKMKTETWEHWKYITLHRTATLGMKAPNPTVYSLNTKEYLQLLSLGKEGRPLIAIFCSCTPPLSKENLNQLAEFKDKADFVLVYTENVDLISGWLPRDSNEKHSTMDQRIEAAEILRKNLPAFSVVVDSMANEAKLAYENFSDRLYILCNGCVAFQGGTGTMHFNVVHAVAFLQNFYKLE